MLYEYNLKPRFLSMYIGMYISIYVYMYISYGTYIFVIMIFIKCGSNNEVFFFFLQFLQFGIVRYFSTPKGFDYCIVVGIINGIIDVHYTRRMGL